MTEQMQLNEGERKVLVGLLTANRRVGVEELAEQLGEKEYRVLSILNVLAGKKFVRLEARESTTYLLTDEGRKYADTGLPEVRLHRAVLENGGSADLDTAVSVAALTPAEKGIAVNWARRLDWLAIRKEAGKTILSVQTRSVSTTLSRLISLLAAGESVVPSELSEALEQARERTLIEAKTRKTFEAWIPEDIRDLAEQAIQLDSEWIGDLTAEMISSGLWRGKKFKTYNVETVPPLANYGKKHPYVEFNDWLRELLVGLGFTEWYGPYVETEFWNNDALFVPQDHVAREVQDQYRVTLPYDHGDIIDERYYRAVKTAHENGGGTGSTGWQSKFSREISSRLCLRAHTTAVSMRYLWEHRESPQKMFIIDRNFRAESPDARHAQEFDQCEGIIMDKGLTLRDLMGYLSEICRRVGVQKVKFKPGQFPFTEPSIETYAKHEVLGWIEVAPGGIFRPEVTHPHGIHDSVLAWGIGSGRLFMAAMAINDIRELFSRDLSWLRRQYFVR